MSDPKTPEEEQGPGLPPSGLSLGGLGEGDYDTSLGQPAGDEPDELIVPRDALLAFRKSGGLRFTSRAIVVYRNGWVVPLEGQGRPRHLSDATMVRLARLLLRSGLARHRAAGQQPPDRYAYEVAARIGRTLRRAEAVDGAIPRDLAPLIAALSRLLG